MFRKVILSLIFIFCCGLTASAQIGAGKIGGEAQKVKDSEEMQILSRPAARYTDEARMNNVQDKVFLRVTFLFSGKIGEVAYIKETTLKKDKLLKNKKLTQYGLVDQAIAAAKLIKFKPGIRNGEPVTIVRTIIYSFDIY